MASLTTMASFLGAVNAADHRRSLVVARAAGAPVASKLPCHESDGGGRRAVLLAAAAASAVWAVGQRIAIADKEPKPGTPEARRKYAPVCVTMPTAKICHK